MIKSLEVNDNRSTSPWERGLGGEDKIGLVLPSLPGYSETFFRNKISSLLKGGAEVVLFVNDSKVKEPYANLKILKAPYLSGSKTRIMAASIGLLCKAVFQQPAKSLKLYRLNKKDGRSVTENLKSILTNQFLLGEQVDWLHFGFGTMALGRENVAAVMGAKMAVSFRGFDYYVYPLKNNACYNILYRKKVKYHVLSEHMKKGLMARGVLENKIVKITPAIDTGLFAIHPPTANKKIQLTSIARLHWIKGLEHTLEALAILKDTIDFHYTIVGEGIERERLLFAVHQLDLNNRVTFTGVLGVEAVQKQLSNTDLYLQYSIQEGFCNAVLEAQAMGLLCVVSDAEGLSENVLHGKTGWVVPKGQPKLLAQEINEVLALDEEQKQRIRLQAMQRVQNEFNLEKQQQEFLEFYETTNLKP